MTQTSPVDILRDAAQLLRQPATTVASTMTPSAAALLRAREPLSKLLDSALDHVEMDFMCCDHGPDHCSDYAGPALAVARAILGDAR